MTEVSVPSQLVENLKNACLNELKNRDGDFIHPSDLERVKHNETWLRRFLLHTDLDEKLAFTMLMDTIKWRKEYGTNEINESNIKMEYVIDGTLFPRGRDKDGCTLFIFNCRKHTKGVKDMEEMQKCMVYWFERLERQENGRPITIFFDLEGCGLSNMDLDVIKYLINLFKLYYPFFLNYIIVYEMAWILSAAFKIIKTWLPPKAVEKIKVLKRADLSNWVPLNEALKCWGGDDDYVFSFLPRATETLPNNNTQHVNKKVHFADGTPMSETPAASGDKDNESTNALVSVSPSSVITFIKDGNELVSTLELQNIDPNIHVSYKMKTTSPEKFRVRPSTGCLSPGAKATITVTLLQGYQIGGLSRDKFLVMSMPVESSDISLSDLTDLWKNVSNKNVSQQRLRCAQTEEITKNGSVASSSPSQLDTDVTKLKQLMATMTNISDCQAKLHKAVERTQMLQWIVIIMVFLLGVVVIYVNHSTKNNLSSQTHYERTDL